MSPPDSNPTPLPPTLETEPPATPIWRDRRRIQRLRWPIMIGVVALAIVIGLYVYLSGGRYETTDDAAVKGARVSVAASISGRVVDIQVRDNQLVKAGQVLFSLDGRPYQTAYLQASAALASARLQVEELKANYAQRQAEVKAAQDDLAYLSGEADRQKALLAAGTGTGAQAANAASQADQARQRLASAREQANAALAALGGNPNIAPDAHPIVRQAAAQVAAAGLNQSYIAVVAPQDGVVTKVDQLQVGDYINAGAPVFSLVSNHIWLQAEFKENQLEYMRPGQHAKIKIDAYPDVKFDAVIEDVSPGTGSSFSLLPAENATGNWVKVTQRVPVNLEFTPRPDVPLEDGLSASVTVDTTHHRHLFGGSPPPEPRR
jgi:membrane fusion protein (multidrug efflux system)